MWPCSSTGEPHPVKVACAGANPVAVAKPLWPKRKGHRITNPGGARSSRARGTQARLAQQRSAAFTQQRPEGRHLHRVLVPEPKWLRGLAVIQDLPGSIPGWHPKGELFIGETSGP